MKIEDMQEKSIKRINEEISKLLLSENKDFGFSWEFFFKFNLESIVKSDFIEEIGVKLDKQDVKGNDVKILSFLSSKFIEDQIAKAKEKLLIDGELKVVYFEDKKPEIVDFFQKKQNVDFLSLSSNGQLNYLKVEGLLSRKGEEKSIYEWLNLTGMQYLYLYQRGSVIV